MVEIYDDETLAAFRASQPPSDLLALVERLVARARAHNLWEDLTCIVVMLAGDDLTAAPWWGEGAAEIPDWHWSTVDGRWRACGLTVGNSGFAYHVLMLADEEIQELPRKG